MMQEFRIDFCNIRGLRANFFAVYAYVSLHKPHVMALNETQVCEGADPLDFHMPGYRLLPLFSPHRGLALFIRNDVAYQYQEQFSVTDAEFSSLWVKFKIRSHVLHFCFLYRSPNLGRISTFDKLDMLSDSISNILKNYPDSEIVVAGDFNIHNIGWLCHSSHTSPEGLYVELFAESNNLTQLVKEPTHIPCVDGQNQNILDLFLTSHHEKYDVSVSAPLGNSDHCTISAAFSYTSCNNASPKAPKRLVWLYEKANWKELNNFFNNFNWKLCFLNKNINAAAKMVEEMILLGMRSFIPNKWISIKPKDNSWFNATCKKAVRSKEEAFKKWRLVKNAHTELLRKQARNSCKAILKRQKFLYEQRLRTKVLECHKGSKSFWSFVKRVKNQTSCSIPTLFKDDQIFTHSVDKANLLARLFAANSSLPESSQPLPEIDNVSCVMPKIHFRTRAVKRVLANLNINKSSGPDGISAHVLKKCASTLARPLRILFNISYTTGEFPSSWKIANVQPVPKKGVTSNPANYRPIAICSTLSKVMESVINFHLMRYLELNRLLSDRQYGFRGGRSTGDLMAILTEKWNQCIHLFGESKVVALDISKAFDRVWHGALVSKLIAYGVGMDFARWVTSFLKDRSICVLIDGVASHKHSINAGVPQGSVLSPTLFLIFINDLLSLTANPVFSFADDSNLCHSYSFSKRPTSLEIERRRKIMNDTLNDDLKLIEEWGQANRVDFNARKTQCCLLSHKRATDSSTPSLSMGGVVIAESDALDVLGISVQRDLRWNNHVFDVAKEAGKCLGFLKRCKKYFTPADLRTIYTTYIRPKMEYNSHLWAGAPQTLLELLDRIQKRAIMLIDDGRVSNSIDSLKHRRDVGCVALFYRYFHGRCSAEIRGLIPSVQLFSRTTRLSRGAHPFHVVTTFQRTTHYRDSSFFSRTVRLWNSLPASVFPNSYDVDKLKTNVHKHFLLFPSSL